MPSCAQIHHISLVTLYKWDICHRFCKGQELVNSWGIEIFLVGDEDNDVEHRRKLTGRENDGGHEGRQSCAVGKVGVRRQKSFEKGNMEYITHMEIFENIEIKRDLGMPCIAVKILSLGTALVQYVCGMVSCNLPSVELFAS